MLEFFLGVWDWFRIPVPIYTVVEGFVATVRMRIQFIQNPPFVRNVTITLMGVPKVEVSVEPFTKKLPNVLDLPLIKQFVEMGINIGSLVGAAHIGSKHFIQSCCIDFKAG